MVVVGRLLSVGGREALGAYLERHAISFFASVSAGFQPAVTRQDGRHSATSELRLLTFFLCRDSFCAET